VSERQKLVGGTAVLVSAATLYGLNNHLHLREPALLPMTWVDRSVPVVPWTVWVYASYPLQFVATFFVEERRARLNRWLWAVLAVNLVSNVVFLLWPTTIERPAVPATDPWTAAAFAKLHAIDTPASCLPSLHVSTAFLASFVFLRRHTLRFTLFFAWAVAIALSTLTTKQHHAVDVVAGLGLAIGAWFFWLRSHEEVPRG
jgi:membrane-associated phospholipid phosphatase